LRKYLKALIVFGMVALMALVGTGVAYAQGPKPGDRGGSGRTFLGSTALEAVAKELGMTADELGTQLKGGAVLADLADKAGVELQKLRDTATAAQQQATRDAIEKAVTDGKLTREQADWMLQGIEHGYSARGEFVGRGESRLGKGSSNDNTELAAAAKVLGMTADQLSTQLWGGRTLAQLAEKAGVKLEDVQTAMDTARQEARRAAIEQAVTDGKLTRAQADWMLQGLDKGYLGRGRGGFSGGRGHRGMPGTKQGTETPAPSSSGSRFQAPAQSTGQSM
jgi:hypothetical protein